MEKNKIDHFNKHLSISKIALVDINSSEKKFDFNLDVSNIKTSNSKGCIDIANFLLPIVLDDDNKTKIFAAIGVPVFPPSEKKPDSLMVMAGKNTSRFFNITFRDVENNYSFKELPCFEPDENQNALINKYVEDLEKSILDFAKKEKNIDHTYAESIKNNVFERNNVEFFKADLFKFSPPLSSLSEEKRGILDAEVLLSKRHLDKSTDLGM